MGSSISFVQKIIYNLVLLLHVLVILMPEWSGKGVLTFAMPYFTFLAFCFAWPSAAKVEKLLSLAFILLGSSLLFIYGLPPSMFIQQFGNMINLLLLVAIAPLFVLPIQFGEYPKSIERLIRKKFNIRSRIYMIVSGVNLVLASLTHYASIPVTDSSLKGILPIEKSRKLQSISQSRGFGLAFLWSPVAALSSTAISETNANLLYMLPIMLVLSIFIWMIDGIWTGRAVQKKMVFPTESKSEKTEDTAKNDSVKLFQFITIIVSFVVLLVSLQLVSSINLLDLVSMLIFCVTLVWSFFLKSTIRFFTGLKEIVTKKIPTLNSQFALFLSVGFFLSCITNTPFVNTISSLLIMIQESIGGFFILFLIIFPFLLSLFGIVPVISVSIVVQTIIPESIGMSNEWFTIGVIAGAVAGVMSSPFLPPLNIVAQVNNISPYLISRWNIKFSFIILGCCVLLVYTLQEFFPNV